ncbi:4-hydroxybenzoate octaprenyltransferase [Pseudomaricurvus alcaniphilus]|uniref:4-hydroxybenzoate octaprenyltransferase n=1 Tax=Pseudomaricurvus alcaniphilus TaxID=1166482 RepID=UPI00140BE1D5|nr:4-hydroxybenzoate octaprenyltransferase [Pseudomaricurvus alcaniphilus]NHN38873.1 4-hydroxybenzoate octaprenyltransferase [Pseudomaricurvus alcaniphilus]
MPGNIKIRRALDLNWPRVRREFPHYWQLMRFDRPIGILLLLWPTLWALWLAADGFPKPHLLVIFVLGVALMRAAGCVINDFADRKVDGSVKRTRQRPLVTGKVSSRAALWLFAGLCLASFGLVLFTNRLTILLSLVAVAVAFCYPFMKRYTHLPQLVLGVAFSWGIPMAFAAQSGTVRPEAWLVFTLAVVWTVAYDTFYAMVDRDDDLRIGVKSTAILFGDMDRVITATLQAIVVLALVLTGQRFGLGWIYDLSLVAVMALFVYQQFLISGRDRDQCFKAFLNNNWVGFAVFLGIALDLALLR